MTVANLKIFDDVVTISLSALEKVEAVHSDVTFPRSAVTGVREVDDGLNEVHGMRLPGTGFPGVVLVGTFREPGRTTFAVCHGAKPAVVIELTGQPYDRIVVTLGHPEDALAALGWVH